MDFYVTALPLPLLWENVIMYGREARFRFKISGKSKPRADDDKTTILLL